MVSKTAEENDPFVPASAPTWILLVPSHLERRDLKNGTRREIERSRVDAT